MEFFVKSSSGSSAIRIVNPNTQGEVSRPQSRKDSVKRKCKNMMLYGSCRMQDNGCSFDHDVDDEDGTSQADLQTSTSPQGSTSPSLSTAAANAPVFVPKASPVLSYSRVAVTEPMLGTSTTPAPAFTPGAAGTSGQGFQDVNPYQYQDYQDQSENNGFDMSMADPAMYQHAYEQQQMENFWPPTEVPFVREQLNYHLYTKLLPPNLLPNPKDTHFLVNSNALREMLHKRSEILHISPAESDLPEEVQGYHTLVPLESTFTGQPEADRDKRKFGSWPSTVYKAVNSADGHTYAPRKVPNFRLMHPSAFSSIEAWSQVRHPGIVSVTEAFTSRAFGESCLFVVYAYHPGAQTLLEAHMMKQAPNSASTLVTFTPPRGSNGHMNAAMGNRNLLANTPNTIAETVLWSYIVQLASAIRVAHEAGLALRQIEVSKVLVTGRNRIRVGGCGLVDVLVHDAQQDMLAVQQEDFVMLGRLIAALCCNNANATNVMNFSKSIEHIQRSYSPEVKNLVLWLIKAPHKHVGQLFESIGYWRLTAETDAALHATDSLEHELMSELENARLVRLMCKINFICERPGFAQDEHWSESGDRYIIKLFRDYVFHRQDQHGNPLLDMGHVLLALNKLDAGVDERILLVARDEQSCLVVSFKDVKRCMETAFQELANGVQAATNYT